jgi:virginiamycin B lyase
MCATTPVVIALLAVLAACSRAPFLPAEDVGHDVRTDSATPDGDSTVQARDVPIPEDTTNDLGPGDLGLDATPLDPGALDLPTADGDLDDGGAPSDPAADPSPDSNSTDACPGCCDEPECIVEFPVPTSDSGLAALTLGPDGNVWFAEASSRKLGRIEPDGTVAEYPIGRSVGPIAITTGPDGALWFALNITPSTLGRMTLDGATTYLDLPFYYHSEALTAGADGHVWLGAANSLAGEPDGVARLEADGSLTHFTVQGEREFSSIVGAPDGRIWFTGFIDGGDSRIGRIGGDEQISEVAIPGAFDRFPRLALAADGSIWFVANMMESVGRLAPDGITFDFFPLGTTGSGNSGAFDIALGPDGDMWVALYFANRLARVTPAGVVHQIDLPTPNSGPCCVVAGGDGRIWFLEGKANQIGAIRP